MRILLLLCLGLVATPVFGQRVFRATDLNEYQNLRLDSFEARIDDVENSVVLLEEKVKQLSEPKKVEQEKPVLVTEPSQPSGYLTTSEIRGLIRRHRPGGWNGAVYADVEPQSAVYRHLVGSNHGFRSSQVNGLSMEEALILHDLAPNHGNKIFPRRSAVSEPTKLESFEPSFQKQVGCANGQCARSTSTSRTIRPRRLFNLFRR